MKRRRIFRRLLQTVKKVPFERQRLSKCTAPKPPLCKGRWVGVSRLGGIVRRNVTNLHWFSAKLQHCTASIPQSRCLRDSSLRRTRSAALTAHRAVIHFRRLRFAYPLHKGALGAPAPEGFSTSSNRRRKIRRLLLFQDKSPEPILIFLTGIADANTLVGGDLAAEAVIFDP